MDALVRWRTTLKDWLELVAIPGLAAVLPWPLCFRLFRALCRQQWLYREVCERALLEATARGVVDDPKRWVTERRLTMLVDHADHYLSRSRSDVWMRRYLRVDGHWPDGGKAGIFCTFHWGAGMWALRHAATAGQKASMMVAMPTREAFPGRGVCYRYYAARTASIYRALGRPPLDVSASLRPALRSLMADEQVMAVVDVPADQVSVSAPIRLLDMPARVPRPLFRLAVEQAIPVTLFLTGIQMTSGQRTLRIRQLGVYKSIDALIADVFVELETVLREQPAQWHFWSESERFFRP